MPPLALTIVNPGAETAPGAEWVSIGNTMGRRSGINGRTGTWCFATNLVGPYEHYQNVPIPVGEYATVDAGLRSVDATGGACVWVGATSTVTMRLRAIAADGVTVLATWELPIGAIDTIQPFAISQRLVPAGTRTLRYGWFGNCMAATDVWVDNLALTLDDTTLRARKLNTYIARGVVPGVLATEKLLTYLVGGPGGAGRVGATKLLSYGVLAPSVSLQAQKAVTYIVLAPSTMPGEYGGSVMACATRPAFNAFGECATRPESAIEACDGERPAGNTFQSGVGVFSRGGSA